MCFFIKIMYVAFKSNRDYEAARRILKVAREELQKLAWQTTSAVQYLKDFMTSEEWDEQDADYINVQLDQLRILLKKSVKGLQEAKARYQEAITLMERNDEKLENIRTDLDNKMRANERKSARLDSELAHLDGNHRGNERRYNNDATEKRAKIYGILGGVATVCAIVDIVGTMGKI